MIVPQGQFEIDPLKDKHKDSVHNRRNRRNQRRALGIRPHVVLRNHSARRPKAVAPDASSQLGAIDL